MQHTSQLSGYLERQGLVERTRCVEGGMYRGIYTQRRFRAGEDILRQGPMARVLEPKGKGERCDECLRPGQRLQRCAGCRRAWYCGVGCQRRAWTRDHGRVCRGRSRETMGAEEGENEEGELVRQTVLALRRENTEEGWEEGVNKEAFLRLDPHWTNQGARDLASARQIAQWVLGYQRKEKGESTGDKGLPNSDLREEEEEIMGHVFRLRSSAFAPTDLQCFPYRAMASYPVGGALLNHSCRPNGVALWDGGKNQVVRIMEDLEPGEEVTLSYVDPCLDRLERREALESRYHFVCQCPRCLEEEEEEEEEEKEGKRPVGLTRPEMQAISELISGDKELLEGLYRTWTEGQFEEWRRGMRIRVQVKGRARRIPEWIGGFERALDGGRWREGLMYGLLLTLIYLLTYPRRHPMVVLQWLMVAKCAAQVEREEGPVKGRGGGGVGGGGVMGLAWYALDLVRSTLDMSFCADDPEREDLVRQVQELTEDLEKLSCQAAS
ncbi:MAG: hypothetical protein DHS80DRAFT_30551 [Piptocephalis tieghemiana]|nr:MAG: hypothetical protein DHS80DRAFT_30551 [Piptocephalis tieghemiana]